MAAAARTTISPPRSRRTSISRSTASSPTAGARTTRAPRRCARSATSAASRSASTRRTAGCGSSRWLQDLRYGWRGLRKSPAFVATTVLTLAVALSLLTVVFTIFNAYVLRPFAVRDPGGLHRIVWRARTTAGRSSGGATTRRCATAATCSRRRSRRTRGWCRPNGPHAVGGLRVGQLLRDAGAAPAARPRPRRRRRARAGGRAEPPGVDAALRAAIRPSSAVTSISTAGRSRSSACCARSSPASTTIRGRVDPAVHLRRARPARHPRARTSRGASKSPCGSAPA